MDFEKSYIEVTRKAAQQLKLILVYIFLEKYSNTQFSENRFNQPNGLLMQRGSIYSRSHSNFQSRLFRAIAQTTSRNYSIAQVISHDRYYLTTINSQSINTNPSSLVVNKTSLGANRGGNNPDTTFNMACRKKIKIERRQGKIS